MAPAKSNVDIQKIYELSLSSSQLTAVQSFLLEHFENNSGNIVNQKQLPSFRLLVLDKKDIIGHVAVEYRKIAVDGSLCSAFCLSDLCIHSNFRGKKIGTLLLNNLMLQDVAAKVDYLLAFSEVPDFYKNNDFQDVTISCKWLLTQYNQTIGVINRKLRGGVLVKSLHGAPLPKDQIDLMGMIF